MTLLSVACCSPAAPAPPAAPTPLPAAARPAAREPTPGAPVALPAEFVAGRIDGGPATRGTSFIVKSVFDRWRARHPDWRVVEKAERRSGQPIIEVARVAIAGREVGPVWFTCRADENFHEFMSSMMDARVEGALGGSALGYFRVTVDYPRGLAVFQ